MSSQMISRYQFSAGSENIKSKQVRMPRIGTKGTKGARKGRFASGLVLRITRTAPQTITKANNVPMLVISASILTGMKLAREPRMRAARIVDFHGVRNFG